MPADLLGGECWWCESLNGISTQPRNAGAIHSLRFWIRAGVYPVSEHVTTLTFDLSLSLPWEGREYFSRVETTMRHPTRRVSDGVTDSETRRFLTAG